MDLAWLLPGAAFAAGVAWPAVRRALVFEDGRRTLEESRRRPLPS